MTYRRLKSLALLASCGVIGLASSAAQANSITFAQFAQLNPGSKIFNYTDLAPTPSGATLTAAPNNAVFVSSIGSLPSPVLALVSLSAFAALPPIQINVPPLVDSQFFSGTLSFTLQVPITGLTNALTVVFTNALFEVQDSTEAPTLTADDHLGSTIQYSSDFADLSTLTNKNFSLSFSSTSLPMTYVSGNLPSVTMSGSGTFAGAVPEPATWGMMIAGLGAVGLAMRSRRTKLAFS